MRRDGLDRVLNGLVERATEHLTDRQREAVIRHLRGEGKVSAAEGAGYEIGSASAVFRGAAVQAALAEIMEKFLTHELVPMALRTAFAILNDDKAPTGVKASLAMNVLDRGGFDAKRHDRQAAQEKDPSQKTAAELRSEIEALEAALLAKARDITPSGAPDDAPISTQDVDFI